MIALAFIMTTLTADGHNVYLWAKEPQNITGATHVLNQVWVSKTETKYSSKKYFEKKAWEEKGIVPLAWQGGEIYRSFSELKLYEVWSQTLKLGHAGFHIDELSQSYPDFVKKAARVLDGIKKEFPQALIYVWIAGPLTADIADLCRKYADAIFLEIYFRNEPIGFERIKLYAQQIEEYGLQNKAVAGLGVGKSWIIDLATFELQIKALADAGLLSNGLVLFAPDADTKLLNQLIASFRSNWQM
jgi:hypothetical protein